MGPTDFDEADARGLPGEGPHAAGIVGGDEFLEQEGMVSRLGPQDEVHPQILEFADVLRIAGETVLDHNQPQMRVFLPDFPQQPLGGVALAVVLSRAVLLDDRLRGEGDDLPKVGMHQNRAQHLMGVGDLSRAAVGLLQAGVAMHRAGGEIAGPIQRQQIAARVEHQRLQGLAPLQSAEHVVEHRPQSFRVDGVQDFAHAGVAGNLADAKELLQVAIMAAGIEGQQRGILQGEHREGRQQRVPQRDLRLGPLVETPLQAGPHCAAQTIGGQMTARLGCGQRHGHIPVRNLSCEAVRRSDSLTNRLRPPKGSACAHPCLRNHDRKHPRFPDVIGSPGIAAG